MNVTDISQRGGYYFTPDIGIFVRDKTYVQFGLDSTRAAIVKSTNAEKLVNAIRAAQHDPPKSRYVWERLFSSSGMTLLAARSLFHDLVDYGILRAERDKKRLVVLGTSPLAKSIRDMCDARGLGVRQPLNWENLHIYLSTMEPGTVVLVVDQLHNTPLIARALHELHPTCSWVPLSIIDSRGFIGPLHIRGSGPCPMCFELRRAELDPRWAVLTRQLKEVAINPDPQVIASVTAKTAVIVDWLVGREFPPGTPKPGAFYAGDFFDVDVYGTSTKRALGQHPQCPECFIAQTG